MDSFLIYLQKTTTLLNFPKNIHVVLGNESCDLDSTVSALALSYFINKLHENGNETSIALPVMNVRKEEFAIRTESNFVLKRIGVNPSTLYYKDTLCIKDLIEKYHVNITLVDHHVLSKEQEYLKPNIIKIFDHRPVDVNANWDAKVDINIKLVGSCSTLIAEEIFLKDSNVLCPSLANILYDTIIFDTIGLGESAGKTTDLDVEIIRKLEEFLNLKGQNHRELFDVLWSAHNDVSHLTPRQLLLKDVKVLDKILIPGLPMLVKDFLNLPDVLDALKGCCKERNSTILILMGLEAKSGVVQRDIAFYTLENQKLLNFIIDGLKKNELLGFIQENCDILELKYFRQNHKPSRKQLLPLVKNLLEEFDQNKKLLNYYFDLFIAQGNLV